MLKLDLKYSCSSSPSSLFRKLLINNGKNEEKNDKLYLEKKNYIVI